MSNFRSLGASWAFSFQPVLPPDYRPALPSPGWKLGQTINAVTGTRYQLEGSPRSSPTVNFCGEIFLLPFLATVLTFFIAGLLYLLCQHPVRRPAFSSHLFTVNNSRGYSVSLVIR